MAVSRVCKFRCAGARLASRSVPTGCVAGKRAVGNTGFAPQKNLRESRRKARCERPRDEESVESAPNDSRSWTSGLTPTPSIGLAATRSDVELCLDELVHRLRVGLAAGCLHHLTDEPSDHCGLRPRLRNFVGIGSDDLV